jgi:hypothetical protein
VFQPIIQFFLALNSQLLLMHDAFITWMVNFSSITSHLIMNFTQTYIQTWVSGLPAATPRPVTVARAQLIRFYRVMAEPTICRYRSRLRGEKIETREKCDTKAKYEKKKKRK